MADLAQAINNARERRGWSVKELAAAAGLHHSTLYRLGEGRPVHAASVRAVVRALHLRDRLTGAELEAVAGALGVTPGSLASELDGGAGGGAGPPSLPLEAWRSRCVALVDRMLATAEHPKDVETALVAMVAALETLRPADPDRRRGLDLSPTRL